ncbi:MAG: 30S ribosomal protein S6 [Clostridia bacterium]|nr:30S ribosomal protein S6 [Clostridia bacterium]
MNRYELMFIIAGDASEEKREELIAKQKAYIEAHKGAVEGIEKIGMKKFAYPIDFKNEGFYVLMNIQLDPKEVDAMSKLMTITDGIVRQMFVKK